MAVRKQSLPEKKESRAGRGALLAMVGISAVCLLALSALILHPSALLSADYPGWWMSRGVVVTNSPATNDYAVANAGQVKWLASNAYVELEANLPGGAGSAVQSMVQGVSATNNYLVVNVGQLKNLALPFYDRLIAEGYTNAYPWTVATTDDTDYAAANIGQAKQLFCFDLTLDADADDMRDWWEIAYFGSITNQSGADDYDGDGLANSNEFWNYSCPTNADTDGDGAGDGLEVQNGSNATNPASFLCYISGTVTYTGRQPGNVHVVTEGTVLGVSHYWTNTMATPGAYTFTNMPNQTQYMIGAWRDLLGDDMPNFPDATGSYAGNPLTLATNTTGIDIALVDVDGDSDNLPDWWEFDQFGNEGQTGFMDYDNDGVNNLDEYTATNSATDGLWLESAGKGTASIAWHPAASATGYTYALETNGVGAGSGGSEAACVTVTGVADWAECTIAAQGTNSGGSVVWSNSLSWTQPGNDLQAWALFTAIPTQALAGAEATLMTREFTNVACVGSWDRFYVSGSMTNGAGFALSGLKLQMEVGTNVHDLCDYGWSDASALDATGAYWIPEGPTNTVKIHARFDGNGSIGLDQRLYFLRWSPGVNLNF